MGDNSNLKTKTISGMIWSFVQRFGTMIIAFVSNIVLARLLTPDDYGTIGMLAIFIAIANTSALEQDFGFKPHTSLREGLRRFAEWHKEFYK